MPLWDPANNYGVPLVAALILATPVWSRRRRGQTLAVGLGLLTLTQIVLVLVTIVATQQDPIISPDGMLQGPGSPLTHSLVYALYFFFELMGRGFFALLIYLGLITLGWPVPAPRGPARSAGGSQCTVSVRERPQGQALLPGVAASPLSWDPSSPQEARDKKRALAALARLGYAVTLSPGR